MRTVRGGGRSPRRDRSSRSASSRPSGGSSRSEAARSSACRFGSDTSAAPSHSFRSSGNGGQLAAAGLRKQHGSEEEERVCGGGEDADGASQRHGRSEKADHAGEQGAHASPEVVAESLPRAAHAGGEQLGEEGAHAAEDAAGEE